MKRGLATVADIKVLLGLYDLGTYKDKEHIDITIENQNFKVTTTAGAFLLKIFDSTDLSGLEARNKLLGYLHKAGVKVPAVIPNRQGGSLTPFGGKYASVYEFVAGKHLERLSEPLARKLAQEIAHLHKAFLRYLPRGLDKKISVYSYSPEEIQLFEKRKLRQCIIHADLGRTNVLVHRSNISAIVDFGDARWDFLAQDLAVLTTIFLNKKDLDYLPVFYEEYQKSIKLMKGEKDSMRLLIERHIHGVLGWLEEVSREKQSKERLSHVEKGMAHFKAMLKLLEGIPDLKL